MLLQLNIINFALIENLVISFNEGFNVFSGETGAGKSILIDAINYVLGSKFNKEFIRTGEIKTYVEAIFTIDNIKTFDILRESNIEVEDTVIISRETFNTGRSIAKVNGKAIILSTLKLISETLIDIHGQHENHNLLDSSTHIKYLDSFGENEIGEYIEGYKVLYKKLHDIKEKISKLQGNDGEREKLISYMKYQIDEIDISKIKTGEDKDLETRLEVLTHAEKISTALCGSYEILYNGSESSQAVFDLMGVVIKDLKSIENYYMKAKDIGNSLQEAYFNIEQNIMEIRAIKDDISFDEKELSEINSRIYEIGKLKKKYGISIDEILSFQQELQLQYDELVNSGDVINKLKIEKEKTKLKCKEIADIIHKKRIIVAKDLETKIKNELNYVGLEKSIFHIDINFGDDFISNGCDKVQFQISTNPGEPVKALEKVASGGELSRIMLALKTVFIDKDRTPTVIFDEIDVGISGRIAQRVAEKMFLISTKHQVLCVTHLPQIACMSQTHYLVYKNIIDEKTFTIVKKLSSDEKEFELAKMIGGVEVTKITIQNSKELILMANNIKNKILS